MSFSEWVVVSSTPLAPVAEMMRERLEVEGIHAVLRGDVMTAVAGRVYPYNISWNNQFGTVQVCVAEEELEQARAILDVGKEETKRTRSEGWKVNVLQICGGCLAGAWVSVVVGAVFGAPWVGVAVGFVVVAAIFILGRRHRA